MDPPPASRNKLLNDVCGLLGEAPVDGALGDAVSAFPPAVLKRLANEVFCEADACEVKNRLGPVGVLGDVLLPDVPSAAFKKLENEVRLRAAFPDNASSEACVAPSGDAAAGLQESAAPASASAGAASRAVSAGEVAAMDLAVAPLEEVLARFQGGSEIQRSVGFCRTSSIRSSCAILGGAPSMASDVLASISVRAFVARSPALGRAALAVVLPVLPNNAFALMMRATCSCERYPVSASSSNSEAKRVRSGIFARVKPAMATKRTRRSQRRVAFEGESAISPDRTALSNSPSSSFV